MREFDKACAEFSETCCIASNWKQEYFGAAYRTRIEAAFAALKSAYENVCTVDDKELGRGKEG